MWVLHNLGISPAGCKPATGQWRSWPAVAVLIGWSLTVGNLPAAVIRVPAERPTIQSGINFASTGDTVRVAPGTYFENLNMKGKAITLTSESGSDVTIIDGNNVGPVITCGSREGTNTVISGFTIQHGFSSWGAGIALSGSSPTIMNNLLQNNVQRDGGFGAAIGGIGASPIIARNVFRNNTADNQVFAGVISFVNGNSPLLVENIFMNNPCRAINLYLPTGSQPVVINNTIVGNTTGIRVDARSSVSAQLYLNNLLFGNGIGLEVAFGSAANYPNWSHNLVFGGQTQYLGMPNPTGLNGNVSADPMLADIANANFRFLPGSPGIDAGENNPQLPATDFDGNPRITAGTINGPALVDIGVFEFSTPVSHAPVVSCPVATVECGTQADVSVVVADPDGDALTVVWTMNGEPVQTNSVPAGNPSAATDVLMSIPLPLGDNKLDISVTDTLLNTASCSTTVTVIDSTPPQIVSATASPSFLWPPDHRMVTVNVDARVLDGCSSAGWAIMEVQSAELVNGHGDDHTSPDWVITGDHTLMLRAERSGYGGGRVYSITIRAMDAANNLSEPRIIFVEVPKSMEGQK